MKAPFEAVVVSDARWDDLQPRDEGRYWAAELYNLHVPVSECAAGIERFVYGPTREACLAETVRQDRLWTELPAQSGDTEEHKRRVDYLTAGAR